jgi:putative transposase
MTYIPTDEGWLYLVGYRDLCTRKIVGYAMGGRMSRNLMIETLLRAVEATHPLACCITRTRAVNTAPWSIGDCSNVSG